MSSPLWEIALISTGKTPILCLVNQMQALITGYWSIMPIQKCNLASITTKAGICGSNAIAILYPALSYGAWARNMGRIKNWKIWECTWLPTAAQNMQEKTALLQGCWTKRLLTWGLLQCSLSQKEDKLVHRGPEQKWLSQNLYTH